MANGYDPYDYLAGPMSPTQRRRAAVTRLMQQLPKRNMVRDEMRAQNPMTAAAIDTALGGGAGAGILKAMSGIRGLLSPTPFATRPFASILPVSGASTPIAAARLTGAGATPAQRAGLAAIATGVAGAPRPTPPVDAIRPARPMTVRGANQWANVDPEAGMDQMFAPAIAAANAAMSDPEAGMDQMYAAEIAQSLKKPTARRVAAKGPTKAQQKIIDDAAKNYQSNSMPVLMQPQGPMKGGATMQPSINWGDANDAADFFRADALRRQMPGLLGWGGE